jgi:tetraacyldisaccharide 4'-kinase
MIKLNYPDFWQKRTCLSYLMLPFAAIYSLAAKIRYLAIPSQKLPGKVICVGNITVGGTGKTQLVIALAKQLTKKKINFVIISKGYGGSFKKAMQVKEHMTPRLVGDEALELCRHGIVIVARKVTDAIPLLQELKADIILVDDGAQNPSFFKDFTIITIDGLRGFGNNFPIPAGPVRKPDITSEIDAIVIITNDDELPPVVNDQFITTASIVPIKSLNKNQKYYAFAGIGNPDKFFNLLKTNGFNLVKTKTFPDHYFYKNEDIELLEKETGNLLASLITTSKDYVKIQNKTNIKCLDVELKIKDEEQLMERIYAKLY